MTDLVLPALAGSALGLLAASGLLLLAVVAITAFRERRCPEPPPETRLVLISTPAGFSTHVAARCRHCERYVTYDLHPEGRADALTLHRRFECPAVREEIK
jgi:hypothetical protein